LNTNRKYNKKGKQASMCCEPAEQLSPFILLLGKLITPSWCNPPSDADIGLWLKNFLFLKG